jgi:hypothetical protein
MKNYYLETYINGKNILGSDYTKVLKSINSKALNNAVKIQTNILKGLENIKPYIKDSNSIMLKVVDSNNKELKQFIIK